MRITGRSNFQLQAMIFIAFIFLFTIPVMSADNPGFFRYPHTNGEDVVFTSEGDLWRVSIGGGTAIRLTTHKGEERFARISPDGKLIAFSGQDDGQDDIYVMPVSGGEPRRLTFHPDREQVVGWSPDGQVLFRSSREIPFRGYRIYKVSPDGSFPDGIRITKASMISFEPNGDRIAFNRYSREFRHWKRYKGGWAQDIWVGNLEANEFANVTDNPAINDWDGTDAFPMWHVNGRIYYLTDRDTRANIWSMKPDGSDVVQHTNYSEFDVRWPAMNGDQIVFQNGMDIYVYDIKTDKSKMIQIDLPTDRVQARVKYVDPKKYMTDYSLSPDGKRVLFCARGELFTAPTKGEGLIRQLTFDSGVREKFPNWSADGEEIYYWSDATGEEVLYRISAKGGESSIIGDDNMGWNFPSMSSPDGKSVVYSNEELELVVMDLKSGKKTVVDQGSWEINDYGWSADGRFLTYSRPEPNYNNTVWIWDSKSHDIYAVTDDYTSSYNPVFDPEGKYLYFLSDRIANPYLDGKEMTYILDKRTMLYAVMLTDETESPFLSEADPSSGDEEWGEDEDGEDSGHGKKGKKGKRGKKDKEEKKEAVKVEIDFDGLSARIVPFPVAPGNYHSLSAVKNNVFYMSHQNRGMFNRSKHEKGPKGSPLHKFNLKREKHKVIAKGIRGYDISIEGEKLMVYKDGEFIVKGFDAEGFDDAEEKQKVKLSDWDLRVEVRPEWQQMFRESWRFQRDFFWTPDMHQVDWQAEFDKYNALTGRISTRDELNDLIGEMFAELNCSHTYVGGGDQRRPSSHPTGLLGADLSRDKSGYFRVDRIIKGRPWEEGLSSPLAEPGVKVGDGDYIINVNGRSVLESTTIFELLVNRANKITSLTINSKPEAKGSHEIVIKPLGSERMLRYWEWVDGRQEYVSEKSDGRIGYIHLSNMGGFGLSQFTAAYQPQHRKPALIMDVRYNGGGFVAEMILSHLGRQLVSVGRPRHGATYRGPGTAFYGHMAAVCNGETGSDGETFTDGFKDMNLGPVIGTRTWGGWVGIRGDKGLVDRGGLTQPEFTGWNMNGSYRIEGWGTDPDMVIKEHPTAEFDGTDPQLDATIEYLLNKLETDPMPIPEPPPYPDRSKFVR